MNQLKPENEEINEEQTQVPQQLEQTQGNARNGFVIEEIPGCQSTGNYVNGKKVGKWTLKFEDRIEEGEFDGKFKVGEWCVTYIHQNLIQQGQFDKLNMRTGEWSSREFQNTEQWYKLIYNRGKVQKKIEVNILMIPSVILKH